MKQSACKARVIQIIKSFLTLNLDCCYVQGIDSITVVIYSEYIDQDAIVLGLLRFVFKSYLNNFIDQTKSLSFAYPCLLMARLLRFESPELSNHFNEI